MDDDTRRTLYNFQRRTEAAFREYEAARRLTLAHLANPNPDAISEYIEAIGHWEQFLSQADRAWTVLVRGEKVLLARMTAPSSSACTSFTTSPSIWSPPSRPGNCQPTALFRSG